MFTRSLAFTIIAPAAALLPAVMPMQSLQLAPTEVAALHARSDPSLGSLRAGRIDAPAPLGSSERAELRAAQQHSTALAAMRGGFALSDNEWKWLAIGAGIVLLVILI